MGVEYLEEQALISDNQNAQRIRERYIFHVRNQNHG